MALHAPRRPQEPGGQGDHRPDELEHSFNGDPDDAEGQEKQPDQGIEHQRQQGQRPAEKQQNAPKQEAQHRRARLLSLLRNVLRKRSRNFTVDRPRAASIARDAFENPRQLGQRRDARAIKIVIGAHAVQQRPVQAGEPGAADVDRVRVAHEKGL